MEVVTITDNEIELRLTSINPPEPEPKRTIYRDIVNLPDPVLLGMTIRYFNHDDVGLYMQITGSCAGYTFGTVNLNGGAVLGSGTDKYENLDEFASRAKPSVGDLPDGEMEENITLILRGYTDAGYSDLKWTFERAMVVHWINSADASFTVDELDNFDDATVQGWAVSNIENNDPSFPTIAVVTDYLLSSSYSVKMTQLSAAGGNVNYAAKLFKSFTTPNKSKVYAILDVRSSREAGIECYIRYLRIQTDDSILIQIGVTKVVELGYPINKWMRFVVPLPPNVTIEIRVVPGNYQYTAARKQQYTWLDDFKIISK